MKKRSRILLLSLLLVCLCGVRARAMENDMLKVGIKYGDEALFSANLQNYNDSVAGLGYSMGYFDSARSFVPLGVTTQEYKITITVDGNFYVSGGAYYSGTGGGTQVGGWHLQLAESFSSYDAAAQAAARYDGAFVAYLTNSFAVRVGQYTSQAAAEKALAAWSGGGGAKVVSPSNTGVVVTVTGSGRVLFYFDCGGLRSLGIMPRPVGSEKPVTWFKGYRYYGGFEYQRVTGGKIAVINVVGIEDYVRGSVGWEIGSDKPLEAIKAQAVCARTYAAMQTRHRSQGFDVCTTVDCQVYQGLASANAVTERAVSETAGLYMYYNGKYAQAYYYSCNGGASEDAKNVWGSEVGYCKGKQDPYEAYVASRIPKYQWTTTYTRSELTERLRTKGINIGTVQSAYVSEFTPNGNVYSVTFVGTSGSKTVYRESCRTTLGLRSIRFNINGAAPQSAGGGGYSINDASNSVSSLEGLYTISGGGAVARFEGTGTECYVATANGTVKAQGGGTSNSPQSPAAPSDTFVISGSGWGHGVGMSQWGAVGMAEQGFDFRDILQFYYTGVTIQ